MMLSDLMKEERDLHAAMIDNYILSASTRHLIESKLRMASKLDYPVTYGIVMVKNSSKTEACFRKYVRYYPEELFEIIADNLVPVKVMFFISQDLCFLNHMFCQYNKMHLNTWYYER